MLTYSVNELHDEYIIKVRLAIESNMGLFRQYNPTNWEEAIQRTLDIAISNREDSYEDLSPYIRKLASTVMLVGSNRETVVSITDDSGEITGPFLSLVDIIDDTVLYNSAELEVHLKEMYLRYPEDFIKLERLFKVGQDIRFRASQGEVIENPELVTRIKQITGKYGVSVFFNMLYKFLKDLPKYIKERPNEGIKKIEMRICNKRVIENIPDIPLIRDANGNLMGVNKETLTMDANPDYVKWDLVGDTSCDIMRLDISPLIEYMYEQIYVPVGVHTKHIFWCDDMYRLKTGGGAEEVNIDREVFMQKVRVELIENLLENRINTIIAISPDAVYIKARREFMYNVLRLKLITGKIVDLPVTIHIKNRK